MTNAAPSRQIALRGGGHGQAIERDDLAPRQPVGEATAHRSDISTGIAATTLPRVIAESGALHANRLRLLQCVYRFQLSATRLLTTRRDTGLCKYRSDPRKGFQEDDFL